MNLKQTFRSLNRDKLNNTVIIVSLAVGIACTSLIAMFISGELGADSFQKNADRLYLLKCDNPFEKGAQIPACRLGGAEYMKENFEEVEDFCRIKPAGAQKIIADGETYFERPVVIDASPNFFEVFSYRLLTNNPKSALETSEDIVISDDLAKKYFGESLPIGQIITFVNEGKNHEYIIKGVFKKPEGNSLFSFDIVKCAAESERFAFLLLKEDADPSELEKKFVEGKDKIPVIHDGTHGRYYLEPLKDAYFDMSLNASFLSGRDKSDLWIAFVIGLLILCIASFNYLGLVRNKMLNKTHEFSVRRINGGSKASLAADFMAENLFVIIPAFTLSLALMLLITPFFNKLVGSGIAFRDYFHYYNLLIMSGVIFFFLFISFSYSVVMINNHVDSLVLKTETNKEAKIAHVPDFNIFQIAVSIVLLVCSVIILKQMRYITNKDIGIDKNVIEVRLPAQFADKAKVFKEEMLRYPAVKQVSVTTASPLLEHWVLMLHYTENGEDKKYSASVFAGDENYISTLGITLSEGRNFPGNEAADKNSCIINESLAKKFPDQNLTGSKLPGAENLTVIGVVKDFHYFSLKSVIDPGYLVFNNTGYHLLIKPAAGRMSEVRKAISESWATLIPDYPLNIESVGDRFEWYHRENEKYSKLIGGCCLISLFLSMIGLFAISFNSSSKRTKEIGIRRINGARVTEVISMLNKEIVKWVLIAYIIACPFAWFVMDKWLENFAYKTGLSWWIFVMAGFLALVIALLTVSWQSWKAASRNPVEALRYE